MLFIEDCNVNMCIQLRIQQSTAKCRNLSQQKKALYVGKLLAQILPAFYLCNTWHFAFFIIIGERAKQASHSHVCSIENHDIYIY